MYLSFKNFKSGRRWEKSPLTFTARQNSLSTFCTPASSEGEQVAEVINCEFELVPLSELPAAEVCLFRCLV